MPLLSAHEDFVVRTLGVLGGAWERLRYVAGLKGHSGDYEHWGLSAIYGEDAAQAAIARAHAELTSKILATPLVRLEQEWRSVGADAPGEGVAPAGLSKAGRLHLNSVIFAVSHLARNARNQAA